MKKLLLTAFSIICISSAFAQKLESSLRFHTGFMHFSGASATSTSSIHGSYVNYTDNPYGTKNGVGFGVELQGQFISKKNIIVGLQLGTEVLKSKVAINQLYKPDVPFPRDATGSTTTNTNYLNLNPYIGIRLPLNKINVDFLTGFEFANVLSSYEYGSASTNLGLSYRTNRNIRDINVDARVKLGITAHYNRLGISAAYAHGLTNYIKNTNDTENFSAHTEVMRVGISLLIF